MLSVEEIKKWCEFADGFEFVEGGNNICRIRTPELGLIISTCSIWNFVYYPLFLQRVIEGINLVPDRWVDIKLEPDTGGSCAWRPRVDLNWISDNIYLDIDQAKEQAIKYILGEIK